MKNVCRGFTFVQVLAVVALIGIGVVLGMLFLWPKSPPSSPPSRAIHGDFITPLPKTLQAPVKVRFLLTTKTIDSLGTVTSTTPLANQTIAFQITTGNASINATSAVTDSSGVATITL